MHFWEFLNVSILTFFTWPKGFTLFPEQAKSVAGMRFQRSAGLFLNLGRFYIVIQNIYSKKVCTYKKNYYSLVVHTLNLLVSSSCPQTNILVWRELSDPIAPVDEANADGNHLQLYMYINNIC